MSDERTRRPASDTFVCVWWCRAHVARYKTNKKIETSFFSMVVVVIFTPCGVYVWVHQCVSFHQKKIKKFKKIQKKFSLKFLVDRKCGGFLKISRLALVGRTVGQPIDHLAAGRMCTVRGAKPITCCMDFHPDILRCFGKFPHIRCWRFSRKFSANICADCWRFWGNFFGFGFGIFFDDFLRFFANFLRFFCDFGDLKANCRRSLTCCTVHYRSSYPATHTAWYWPFGEDDTTTFVDLLANNSRFKHKNHWNLAPRRSTHLSHCLDTFLAIAYTIPCENFVHSSPESNRKLHQSNFRTKQNFIFLIFFFFHFFDGISRQVCETHWTQQQKKIF